MARIKMIVIMVRYQVLTILFNNDATYSITAVDDVDI